MMNHFDSCYYIVGIQEKKPILCFLLGLVRYPQFCFFSKSAEEGQRCQKSVILLGIKSVVFIVCSIYTKKSFKVG